MEHNAFDASNFLATPPGQERLEGTPSSRRDCIRLLGLPREAQVLTIVKFLGEHAFDVVFRGVHLIYSADGRPSGEAFAQMGTEDAAFSAVLRLNGRYIAGARGPYYVEVFQCSMEDITNMGAVPWETALLGGTYVRQPAPGGHSGEPGVPGLQPAAPTLPPMAPPTASLTAGPCSCPPTSPVDADMCAHVALLGGLPPIATVHDILALFPGVPEMTTDCVAIQQDALGLASGEALVTFPGHVPLRRIIEALRRYNIGVELLIV